MDGVIFGDVRKMADAAEARELARLRRENARLRDELSWFADQKNYMRREGEFHKPDGSFYYSGFDSNVGVFGFERAKQALAAKENDGAR